jgi:acylphosphatase
MVKKHHFLFVKIIFLNLSSLLLRRMSMKVRARLLISGRVQRVHFRQSTLIEAQALGVTGWVRNLMDGRVEAVFEGEEHAVKTLVNYCRSGPSAARVDYLDVSYGPCKSEFPNFKIL